MGKMMNELQLLLVKEQSAFGTAEDSLGGTDIIETIGAPTFAWSPEVEEINLVGGGFDQDIAIPGAGMYEVSFSVHMASGGTEGGYGQAGTLLDLCAMTKTETDDDSDGTDDTATWVFSSTRSDWKDATAWLYSGDKSTTSSLLQKANNIIFNPKWNFENGKPVTMELSGMGVFGGAPANSTQPSVTKQRVNIPAFFNTTTLTINGDSGYNVISGSIDAGQESTLTVDPTQTYGRGISLVTNRKIKFNFTVYQDITTNVDPRTALLNKTEGALTIVYGSTPQKITFDSDYAQITNVTEGDNEGVQTFEISGQINRNDLSVTMDTQVA